MDMILTHMTFENIDFQIRTNLTNQVTQPGGYRADQEGFTKFGDPYKMQLDVKFRVRCPTVIVHKDNYTAEIA